MWSRLAYPFEHTFNSREKPGHRCTPWLVFKATTFREHVRPSTTCCLFGKGVEQGKTGHCKHFTMRNPTRCREHQERACKHSFKGTVDRSTDSPLFEPLADTGKLGHKSSICLSSSLPVFLPVLPVASRMAPK